MSFIVRELIRSCEGSLLSGTASDVFDAVSIDSRTMAPGSAFFALRGPRFDGHVFLAAAADRGAATLVIDRAERCPPLPPDRSPSIVQVTDALAGLQKLAAFQRSRAQALIIGITGSNGKTTTKEMLACILRQAGPMLATRGNLNNHIGLPLMLCELRPEHRFAVLEMGTSKKGDMELLVRLARPDIGLITNVGKDHLEFLGTPEGVLNENRLLLDRLPKNGTALINVDDPLLQALSGHLLCRTLTYGTSADATIRATDIVSDGETVKFVLTFERKSYDAHLFIAGPFQALNATAAAAAAYAAGIAPEQIIVGLSLFRPVAMRMQAQTLPHGTLLMNDAYNANPSSMRASIESFCASYGGRSRWAVLGDMRELGTIARQEHLELGQWLAGQPLDRVFLYGRDSRFILEGLKAHGSSILVERFKKKRHLAESLKQSMAAAKPAILFKASRSLRLEDVIASLAR